MIIELGSPLNVFLETKCTSYQHLKHMVELMESKGFAFQLHDLPDTEASLQIHMLKEGYSWDDRYYYHNSTRLFKTDWLSRWIQFNPELEFQTEILQYFPSDFKVYYKKMIGTVSELLQKGI